MAQEKLPNETNQYDTEKFKSIIKSQFHKNLRDFIENISDDFDSLGEWTLNINEEPYDDNIFDNYEDFGYDTCNDLVEEFQSGEGLIQVNLSKIDKWPEHDELVLELVYILKKFTACEIRWVLEKVYTESYYNLKLLMSIWLDGLGLKLSELLKIDTNIEN